MTVKVPANIPKDWLEEEARRFLRVLSELLRHTLAQLLNDCRCKVFFLSPNSMDDGHCDALGHKGTSRQTYNGEILLDIDQFEFS